MVVCFKPTGAVPPPEGTPPADLDQHGGGTPSHYFVLLRDEGPPSYTFLLHFSFKKREQNLGGGF